MVENYVTTTKLEYQDIQYELSGTDYTEWVSKQEAIDALVGMPDGEKDNAREWITYHTLMGAGNFISKPPFKEPQVAKIFETDEPQGENELRFPIYEPAWTQGKLLDEREKFVRKQEIWIKKQNALLERKQEEVVTIPRQFYHADGSPYSKGDYSSSLFTFIFVIGIVILLVSVCRH